MEVKFNLSKTPSIVEEKEYRDFLLKHNELTLEELQAQKETEEQEYAKLEVIVDQKIKKSIINFIESKDRIFSYGAREWTVVSNFVEKLKNTKTKSLDVTDILVLRELQGNSRFTDMDAIRDVAIPLNNFMIDVNIETYNRSTRISKLAELILRKETELQSELKFAEGDLEKSIIADTQ